MKCIICGNELGRNMLCDNCGFDVSICLENYPTLMRKTTLRKPLSKIRKEYIHAAQNKDASPKEKPQRSPDQAVDKQKQEPVPVVFDGKQVLKKSFKSVTVGFILLLTVIVMIGVARFEKSIKREKDAQAERLYNSALEDYEAGNYETALTTLYTIDPTWSSYAQVEALRDTTVLDILMNQIQIYESSGDYVSIIQLIEASDSGTRENASVKLVYEQAVSNYRDKVVKKAEAALTSEGYGASVEVINQGLSILSNDPTLEAEKERYISYAPVDLTSLNPYFEGTIDVFTDGISDTMGNHYSSGIRGYMSASDVDYFDCYNIWDIGGQYDKLTATGIIMEADKGSRCEGSYKIYGDGLLLYEKANIGSQTKPYQIEIDITGVTDLKIEMFGEGNMGTSGIDSVLVDVMLQKSN